MPAWIAIFFAYVAGMLTMWLSMILCQQCRPKPDEHELRMKRLRDLRNFMEGR